MNFRRVRILVLVILLGSVLINYSCGDDGAITPGSSSGKITDSIKSKLYNKVWYPTIASGGTNLEFKTDGNIYRINKSLDGTWEWRNNGDTMDVRDYGGARYSFIFELISDNQMKYRYNFGGDGFGTLYTMKDTE